MVAKASFAATISNRGRVSAARTLGHGGGGGLQGQASRVVPNPSYREGGVGGGGMEEGDRPRAEEGGKSLGGGGEGGGGSSSKNISFDMEGLGNRAARGRVGMPTRSRHGGSGGQAVGAGGGRGRVGGGGSRVYSLGVRSGGRGGRGVIGSGGDGDRGGGFGGGRRVVHGGDRNWHGYPSVGRGGVAEGVLRCGGNSHGEFGDRTWRNVMGDRFGGARHHAGRIVHRDGDRLIIDRAVDNVADEASEFVKGEEALEGDFEEEFDEGYVEDLGEEDDLLEEEEEEEEEVVPHRRSVRRRLVVDAGEKLGETVIGQGGGKKRV